MEVNLHDVEIIRAVRRLCLRKEFSEAINLAYKVEDRETRNTLLFICHSFENSSIKTHAA